MPKQRGNLILSAQIHQAAKQSSCHWTSQSREIKNGCSESIDLPCKTMSWVKIEVKDNMRALISGLSSMHLALQKNLFELVSYIFNNKICYFWSQRGNFSKSFKPPWNNLIRSIHTKTWWAGWWPAPWTSK